MQVLRTAFSEPLDKTVSTIVNSIQEDKELIHADLTGSIAHATMLGQQGLLTAAQAQSIVAGLKELDKLAANGEFELFEEYEDVHMNVEKQLEKLIGEDALRLHTARSRNDQVALDFRLYVGEQINAIVELLVLVQSVLLATASANPHMVMPGYTHLQRAQPILFSHALLAFFQMLQRDKERFQQCAQRTAVSPLGAGAQAGTSLATNPELTAKLLDMSGVFANSVDAVMDRDFAAEFLMNAGLCAVHLSQLCETLVIWNSAEFGFVKFADSVTTSSSLMPQKKNPDPLEIVRGKTGSAIGDLVNMLVTLKGLHLGYNRDLQETKAPVIRTAKSLTDSLKAIAVVISAMTPQSARMLECSQDTELMATDGVEYLVKKGVPFRTAHETIAVALQHARETKCKINELTLPWLTQLCPQFSQDFYFIFDPLNSASSKISSGGTGNADQVVQNLLSSHA